MWITSDGADLWIIGTHGDPPPIDPSRLPAFETYFTDADPAGDSGGRDRARRRRRHDGRHALVGPAGRGPVAHVGSLRGRGARLHAGTPILVTTSTVVTIAHDPGSGPWYYKVRAINSRGEASTDVEVGPFTLPALRGGPWPGLRPRGAHGRRRRRPREHGRDRPAARREARRQRRDARQGRRHGDGPDRRRRRRRIDGGRQSGAGRRRRRRRRRRRGHGGRQGRRRPERRHGRGRRRRSRRRRCRRCRRARCHQGRRPLPDSGARRRLPEREHALDRHDRRRQHAEAVDGLCVGCRHR